MDVSIRWRLMKYRDIKCELLVNDDVMERVMGWRGWKDVMGFGVQRKTERRVFGLKEA